jgi:chromosomal replication initiation ATPase DnaA
MEPQAMKKISPYIYPGLPCAQNNELMQILFQVCKAAKVNAYVILTRSRVSQIVDARSLYCYLAKKNTKYNFREIGEVIGIVHSSVIWHIHRVNRLVDAKDKRMTGLLNKV